MMRMLRLTSRSCFPPSNSFRRDVRPHDRSHGKEVARCIAQGAGRRFAMAQDTAVAVTMWRGMTNPRPRSRINPQPKSSALRVTHSSAAGIAVAFVVSFGAYAKNTDWYEECEVDEWNAMMNRVNWGLPPDQKE